MTRALVYKELREVLGIAALGVAASMILALTFIGWRPLEMLWSSSQGTIPFVNDSFATQFGLLAFALAAALGFRQSLGDFLGDAQMFLLHRPVSRQHVYGVKLAVGLGAYLLCAAVPVLLYGWWAAQPGTHASPFDWSMTHTAWRIWLGMTAVYLGAFLAGIRPAAWFGTRLLPLVTASGVFVLFVVPWSWMIALPVLAAVDAVLVVLILHVVATRDFG